MAKGTKEQAAAAAADHRVFLLHFFIYGEVLNIVSWSTGKGE
jgi:hypothetical protein